MTENERRRQTARDAWLLQLTPEQRAEVDAGGTEAPGETPLPDGIREALQRAVERRD